MMWTWKHEIHKLLATTHSMWYHFDDDEHTSLSPLIRFSLSFVSLSLSLSLSLWESTLLSMCYLGYLFCIYLLPGVYHHSLMIWFACTNSIGYHSNWMKPIYNFFLWRVKRNEMQCTNVHIAHDVMWLFLSSFFLLSFFFYFFLTLSPSFVQLWILVFLCFLSVSHSLSHSLSSQKIAASIPTGTHWFMIHTSNQLSIWWLEYLWFNLTVNHSSLSPLSSTFLPLNFFLSLSLSLWHRVILEGPCYFVIRIIPTSIPSLGSLVQGSDVHLPIYQVSIHVSMHTFHGYNTMWIIREKIRSVDTYLHIVPHWHCIVLKKVEWGW